MDSGILADGLLLTFLLAQTWLGCRRGFLQQAAAFAALGFGVALGLAVAPALGVRVMARFTSNNLHARILAFLLVFGLVALLFRLFLIWAEHAAARGAAKKEREKSKGDDRVLGGMFGALKGLLIAFVAAAAGMAFWPNAPAWESSHLAPPFATAGARLLPEGTVEQARNWAAALRESDENESTAPAARTAQKKTKRGE